MAYYLGSTYDRQSRRAVLEDATAGKASAFTLFLLSRQFAVAASDTSIGTWTTQAGGTSNLFATIDETLPDDSDYIRSSLAPSSDAITLAFGTLQLPISGPQYLRYRYGKDDQSARIDLTVELLQGASVVQTWTHTDVPLGFTEVAQLITGSITDTTILSIRFTATQV